MFYVEIVEFRISTGVIAQRVVVSYARLINVKCSSVRRRPHGAQMSHSADRVSWELAMFARHDLGEFGARRESANLDKTR